MNPKLKFDTLGEMVEQQGNNKKDRIFLIDPDNGRRYTYGEIDEYSSEVASRLSKSNIQSGDKVSLVLENCPELVIAICGIQKQGAVAVPINYEYTPRELSYIIKESNSKLAITQKNISEKIESVENDTNINNILYTEESSEEYYRSDSGKSKLEQNGVTPTDTAILMFTSGTTGDPKGVALSHMNMMTRFAGGSLITDGSYIFYTVLPMYNIDGFSTTFATMYRGQQNVLKDRFSASDFWSDVENFQANITSVVPSILSILMKNGLPDNTDISSFNTFFVSGSYVSEELVNDFEEMFDIDVMEIYGLTEASGTSFKSAENRKSSSCGRENRYSELAILDEDTGDRLTANEQGEIVIRGPTVFKEYYNNKEATEKSLNGGWFHTGDIGYMDEEDYYYVLDRKKNIIIKGGQNVYPGEIEDIIHSSQYVNEAAIVGEEDQIYGEIIKAYISIQSTGSEDSVISSLKTLCKDNLVDYKIPDEFVVVNSFPRGETGKILKENLN